MLLLFFFFSSRRRHTRFDCDWSSDVCSSDLLKATIAAKNIGYELRCADPIPMDMEYTRDLGYCAAKYVLGGGNAAMISLQAGRFGPTPRSAAVGTPAGRAPPRPRGATSTGPSPPRPRPCPARPRP